MSSFIVFFSSGSPADRLLDWISSPDFAVPVLLGCFILVGGGRRVAIGEEEWAERTRGHKMCKSEGGGASNTYFFTVSY